MVKTTRPLGVVARVATMVFAAYLSGCTNDGPSEEEGCNGFCPTGDGNISPLTVDGDVGPLPCNGGCSTSFTCVEVDSNGDGTTEEVCVLSSCGNGVLDSGEDCDGGDECFGTCHCPNGFDPNLALGCEEPPPTPVCGNGVLEGTEECDDSNTTDGDGCDSDCMDELPAPVCGNGVLEGAEECDDNNTTDGDGCSATCADELPAPVCGNGAIEGAEECDDNNNTDGDGCSATCATEPPPEEICDNGDDEDGDGMVDAADDDCLLEEVAAIGCYLEFGGTVFIDTAVVSGYQETYPFNTSGTTVDIGINGADTYARIRVSAAALSCSSGQSFVVWTGCGDPDEPWPTGGGVVREPGEPFTSTDPDWYCLLLVGATE